jgi:hypothetical protein
MICMEEEWLAWFNQSWDLIVSVWGKVLITGGKYFINLLSLKRIETSLLSLFIPFFLILSDFILCLNRSNNFCWFQISCSITRQDIKFKIYIYVLQSERDPLIEHQGHVSMKNSWILTTRGCCWYLCLSKCFNII